MCLDSQKFALVEVDIKKRLENCWHAHQVNRIFFSEDFLLLSMKLDAASCLPKKRKMLNVP